MNPLKCLPSSGQTSMTKGFPDLRPVAGRTVSGVLQTGQGTLFIGLAPCEVLAAQRIQGIASLVGVGAFTCGAYRS